MDLLLELLLALLLELLLVLLLLLLLYVLTSVLPSIPSTMKFGYTIACTNLTRVWIRFVHGAFCKRAGLIQ